MLFKLICKPPLKKERGWKSSEQSMEESQNDEGRYISKMDVFNLLLSLDHEIIQSFQKI